MKNLVSTAKMLLIERATEVYTDRRSELHPSEYPGHYYDLGKIIVRIDEYISLSAIINDIEQDEYSNIGLFGSDDDLATFMKEIYEEL